METFQRKNNKELPLSFSVFLCSLCVIFLITESLKFPPLITFEAETSESSLKVVLSGLHESPVMHFYLKWCGTPVESSGFDFFLPPTTLPQEITSYNSKQTKKIFKPNVQQRQFT